MRIRCGFEWHIQLNTGKLFCRCTPKMHEEPEADLEVARSLRPSFGESGKIDVSAAFEGGKARTVVYKVYNDSDCLVDLDEEPPHEPDAEAVEIAMQMGYALRTKVFDNIMFMRKTIVDGSNTSGFQRTAMIGLNGSFSFDGKKIGIESISLEEDSARKEDEDPSRITYKLDRLGIPLIEVATSIINTDEKEAKEIALSFGKFTRLFNVRRGIGTIRQDVNLSIEGGSRVELKGFQNIREMDKVIENEARRQVSLIKLSKEKAHLIQQLDSLKPMKMNEEMTGSGSNMIKNSIEKSRSVMGVRIPEFSGLFGTTLTENKRFGTEVGDYLRARFGSGIIHSDELPAFGIDEEEKKRIAEKLGCGKNDLFVIFICDAGKEKDVLDGLAERAKALLTSVPSEVRLVREDNSTAFLRPMGGRERMYVETDLPVIRPDKELIRRAKSYEGFDATVLREKYGMTEEHMDLLIGVNRLGDAIRLNREFGVDFVTLVRILVEDFRYIRRKFDFELDTKTMADAIKKVKAGEIPRDAPRFIFESIALGKVKSVDDAIEKYNLKKISRKRLEEEIKKLIVTNELKRYDTLITTLRDRLGFSFDAKEAYEIASKLLKNG